MVCAATTTADRCRHGTSSPPSDSILFVPPADNTYLELPENKLTLQNGNTLVVKAPKVSDKNCYVQSVKLNGKEIHRGYITYDEILAGGTLEFTMGSKPNKNWFTETPYSMSGRQ